MAGNLKEALVAASERSWRGRYADALLANGFDVHTASSADQAFNLLRKHTYDLIVMDDSVSGMELLEFGFNVRDLAANNPIMLIAAEETPNLSRACAHIGAEMIAPRQRVMERLEHLADCMVEDGTDPR